MYTKESFFKNSFSICFYNWLRRVCAYLNACFCQVNFHGQIFAREHVRIVSLSECILQLFQLQRLKQNEIKWRVGRRRFSVAAECWLLINTRNFEPAPISKKNADVVMERLGLWNLLTAAAETPLRFKHPASHQRPNYAPPSAGHSRRDFQSSSSLHQHFFLWTQSHCALSLVLSSRHQEALVNSFAGWMESIQLTCCRVKVVRLRRCLRRAKDSSWISDAYGYGESVKQTEIIEKKNSRAVSCTSKITRPGRRLLHLTWLNF